jgi:hypothetical protein
MYVYACTVYCLDMGLTLDSRVCYTNKMEGTKRSDGVIHSIAPPSPVEHVTADRLHTLTQPCTLLALRAVYAL